MNNYNLNKRDIINRIGYFRTQKKISAYKISYELGHSNSYMYRIENGEIPLTMDTFLEILEILGVSTTEFFCPNYKDEDKTLVDLICNLSEESKTSILNIVKKLK